MVRQGEEDLCGIRIASKDNRRSTSSLGRCQTPRAAVLTLRFAWPAHRLPTACIRLRTLFRNAAARNSGWAAINSIIQWERECRHEEAEVVLSAQERELLLVPGLGHSEHRIQVSAPAPQEKRRLPHVDTYLTYFTHISMRNTNRWGDGTMGSFSLRFFSTGSTGRRSPSF